MSHPENTFKQIIERQDKKIEGLIKAFELYIATMYSQQGNIGMEQAKKILEMLDEVRKL